MTDIINWLMLPVQNAPSNAEAILCFVGVQIIGVTLAIMTSKIRRLKKQLSAESQSIAPVSIAKSEIPSILPNK